MVFHRELFTQVGFDPAITRGEDIDYLINARIAGHIFLFDSKLSIMHLPPRHFESFQYAKMRQDVFRFIYEKEKLQWNNMSPDEFAPYPGRLLGSDLILSALDALHAFTTPKMRSKFGSPDEIVASAQVYAKEFTPQYAAFAAIWPKAIKVLKSQEAKDELHRII
jgi:hypothetical protein